MRVFITGAGGYVGSAIARAFAEAGHEVTGMVHSPESADVVRTAGARPVEGDINEPDSYEQVARDHGVLVHAALDYDTPVESDLTAIGTLLGTGTEAIWKRHIIYTSGCWVLGNTGQEPADENTPVVDPPEIVAWRPTHERQVLGASDETLQTAVVRPGMVYGGRGGFVSRFFESAIERGTAEHVGDGQNRWSLVHREDLGRLYVRIAESRAGGVFHGVDGAPVQVTEAARAASEAAGAGGRTRAVPLEEARREMGPVVDGLVLDQALVTRRADAVKWAPEWPSFVERAEKALEEWRSRGEALQGAGTNSVASNPSSSSATFSR